jgi:hypothetical protein
MKRRNFALGLGEVAVESLLFGDKSAHATSEPRSVGRIGIVDTRIAKAAAELARMAADKRTEAQQRNLTNITRVIRIPERGLVSYIGWATVLFQDITQQMLDGRSPFSNLG